MGNDYRGEDDLRGGPREEARDVLLHPALREEVPEAGLCHHRRVGGMNLFTAELAIFVSIKLGEGLGGVLNFVFRNAVVVVGVEDPEKRRERTIMWGALAFRARRPLLISWGPRVRGAEFVLSEFAVAVLVELGKDLGRAGDFTLGEDSVVVLIECAEERWRRTAPRAFWSLCKQGASEVTEKGGDQEMLGRHLGLVAEFLGRKTDRCLGMMWKECFLC